ncbi:MAG: glycoside hydrolase [Lachnospiraceae bacterium]|jgi:spore germination protein YaaH|nr:glycoside hydrolase [Lachnospiraceae bacterium]
MKQNRATALYTLAFVIVLLLGIAFFIWVTQFKPNDQHADMGALLGVGRDEVAIFLDGELQGDGQGVYADALAYLPVSWVNAHVNERFYWDAYEEVLVYALPESIDYIYPGATWDDGRPRILTRKELAGLLETGLIGVDGDQLDEMYISVPLLLAYTDLQAEVYAEGGSPSGAELRPDAGEQSDAGAHSDAGEQSGAGMQPDSTPKRIYLETTWETKYYCTVNSKKATVRTGPDIHDEVVADLAAGAKLRMFSQAEGWAHVMTAEGFLGYVEGSKLREAGTVAAISGFEAPQYSSIRYPGKICLGFHQVLSAEANSGLTKLAQNAPGMNVVAPTWIFLTDNYGGFETLADKEYVEKAHAMGLKVWAVADNFNRGDNVQSHVLFAHTGARQKLIVGIMDTVETYGIDGVNMDIEGIREEAGVHYVQFLRELSVACRLAGVALSIDNYTPSPSSEFYNRKEQGTVADYLIIMGYDEHYAGGEPGSVASLGFVRDGIEGTLAVVPKEKIINAVPLYSRVWIESGQRTTSQALGMAATANWVAENGVDLYWQEELGQYYGELRTDTGRKYVWVEDDRSLERKVELVREYDLAGVACWKLGFEDENTWGILDLNK